MSTCIHLDDDWLFIRRRAGRGWLAGAGAEGDRVSLPHCWNATDEFMQGVPYYRGYGSYRKEFVLPEAPDAAWALESEGFYGTGELWLNGRRVGPVDGQYLGFSMDVGAHLRPGAANTIALRLTNRCARHVLPGIKYPDFLLYGGLSGRVKLTRTPLLRLARGGLRVSCRTVTDSEAEVELECAVENRSALERRFAVKWTVTDATGREAAGTTLRDLDARPGACREGILGTLRIAAPRRWSPDNPYLYRVDCELLEQGRPVDRQAARLGIRKAEFKPGQGFFLNGERTFLRGCNRHESMPGFGRALPENLHREDAAQIKSLGLNFVRLSHYPQHPAFLDACDELGITVCAELASWKSVRGGRWLKAARGQWRDMILRDRNHPSVIMWCMGNESRHRGAYLELRRIARELDPDRPVTYAENHMYRARRKATLGIPDVWGSNYELELLDEGAAASAMNCVLVTECSCYPAAVRGDAAEEARQAGIIEGDLKRLRDRPAVAGFAVWSFNDYATLRKNRYQRFPGVVDAWRVPKMSGALLQALFLRKPFVRVFADWAEHPPGVPAVRRPVRVLTNCGEVILKVNGRTVATLGGGPMLETNLEFCAGELSAEGVSGGERVVDRIASFGRPVRISAEPDKRRVPANARETIGVALKILDDRGNPVRNWKGNVEAAVEGPARLRHWTPNPVVAVSAGCGRTFITGSGEPGAAVVRVFHPSLGVGLAVVEFAAE